jgi:hypothetical protein
MTPGKPLAQQAAPAPTTAAKPKKPIYKRWWMWLLGIVLVIILANALGGGSDPASDTSSGGGDTSSEQPADDAGEAPEEAAGLGTAVRDGKFEFTVNGMDCSRSELGTPPVSTTAQGVFCIVSIHVSNIGDEAQFFDASSQTALDAEGREFSANSGAAVYLGDQANSFLEQLNPGSVVEGQLVYDVPAGTQLTQMELHDSPFSSGVKVNLS